MQNYMTDQSLEMGYHPQPIGTKDWRRNLGNTNDRGATAAERDDNIMRHNEGSDVFRTSYLNANVQFDVQSAVLGEPMQNQLLKMLSHVRTPHSRSTCPRNTVWSPSHIVTSKVGQGITIVGRTRCSLLNLFDLGTHLRAFAYPGLLYLLFGADRIGVEL